MVRHYNHHNLANIYYKKHWGANEIWRVDKNGGNEKKVLRVNSGLASWLVTKNGIYLRTNKNGTPWLEFYDFKTKELKEIKALPESSGSMAVDEGERYLLYTKVEANWSDIVLVENFRTK